MKSNNEILKLAKKISKGLELSFQRLVEKTAKEDGELVFSQDGKIVRVKAKDLLKKQK